MRDEGALGAEEAGESRWGRVGVVERLQAEGVKGCVHAWRECWVGGCAAEEEKRGKEEDGKHLDLLVWCCGDVEILGLGIDEGEMVYI